MRIAPIERSLELTILMPCLDEAETLGVCIDKARSFLQSREIAGEVLVADNGSTDGSVAIAEAAGARVIHVVERGYGAALIHGIAAARGRYVVMGDADDSYDFLELDPMLARLRAGDELVMGNRFRGSIAKEAMPFLHRYLGNPVLSFLGRLFFRVPIGDFHCGLRGFDRDRMSQLPLLSPGMEFASEMVVKSRLHGLRIGEVPVSLRRDGRSRPPHLKTWSDGWRHLKFLLLHSPRWLFLYPGAFLFLSGLALTAALYRGPLELSRSLHLDVNTLIVGCMMMLVGAQATSFGVLARRYAAKTGMLPASAGIARHLRLLSFERILVLSGLLFAAGCMGLLHSVRIWAEADFGDLRYGSLVKPLVLSGTVMVIGLQLMFTACLSALLDTRVLSGKLDDR